MENEIAHLQRTISLRGWPTIMPTNCVRLPLLRRGDSLCVILLPVSLSLPPAVCAVQFHSAISGKFHLRSALRKKKKKREFSILQLAASNVSRAIIYGEM